MEPSELTDEQVRKIAQAAIDMGAAMDKPAWQTLAWLMEALYRDDPYKRHDLHRRLSAAIHAIITEWSR